MGRTIEKIELITKHAIRPVDIRCSNDSDMFGLGAIDMTFLP
jgi:hypothetical protein